MKNKPPGIKRILKGFNSIQIPTHDIFQVFLSHISWWCISCSFLFFFKELPNEMLHHFLHLCLFISYPLALLFIAACYFCCNFCFLKHKISIFEFRAYVIYQNLKQLWTSDWCQVGSSHIWMLELDHEES